MLQDAGFENFWRLFFGVLFVFLFLAYGFVLARREKFWWAWSIASLRFLWLSPVLFLMWPKKVDIGIDQPLRSKTLFALVDDSESMKRSGSFDKSLGKLDTFREICKELACKLDVKYLSEFTKHSESSPGKNSSNFTFMNESLESWLKSKFSNQPVIVFSDGGDHLSRNLELSSELSHETNPITSSKLYLYYGPDREANYAITHTRSLGLSFSNQKPSVEVSLQRSEDLKDTQRKLQIQIYAIRTDNTEHILATQSFKFQKGELRVDVGLELPVMTKGQYMLYARLLTPPEDRVAWDNHHAFMIKILPNTVGLLHLLGAPSWDGRFLRRYIKSEIKYDTVSFYILRDPTDLIPEKDRELSLIPFPVERLFTKELSRFKVLIMQNFALSYFLDQEEYRNNLVKFVKEGGGLLFIGGPRALLQSDVQNSSLKEILPFTEDQIQFASQNNKGGDTQRNSKQREWSGFGLGRMPFLNANSSSSVFSFMGSSWNQDLKYRLRLEELDASSQKRISFWSELQSLAPEIENIFSNSSEFWGGLQDVKFPSNKMETQSESQLGEKSDTTVELSPVNLMSAEIIAKREIESQREKRPWMMASFPGKGRALWILSDEVWKLANQPPELASRGLYTKFMQMLFQWLLKEDLRPALQWQGASLHMDLRSDLVEVRLELLGPATLELDSNPSLLSLNVCGKNFDSSVFQKDFDEALESLVLKAKLSLSFLISAQNKKACLISYETQSPAYGNLKNEMLVGIQKSMSDEEFPGSEWNGRALSRIHDLEIVEANKFSQGDLDQELRKWLEGFVSEGKESLKPTLDKNLSYWDYFYWLNGFWFFWILFIMVAEVFVQRRKWIFGSAL